MEHFYSKLDLEYNMYDFFQLYFLSNSIVRMPIATYIYSNTDDFPNGINAGKLFGEIEAEPLITVIVISVVDVPGDDVEIKFEDTLPVAEKTKLDELVASHIPFDPPALVENGFINGLTLNRPNSDRVKVFAGSCRDSTDSANIVLNVDKLAIVTVTGKGGLDTGIVEPNTWYVVYVIGDATNVQEADVILSKSTSGPIQPIGYNLFRRIGWTRTKSNNNLLDWDQTGVSRTRRYHYDETINATQVLTGGQASAYTDIDCGAFVPPTSTYITVVADFKTGSAGNPTNSLRLRRKGFTTNGVIRLRSGIISDNSSSSIVSLPCNANQKIQYKVSDTINNIADISIVGYEDDI